MAQRANNAYYRDPDVARGFNNLSSAILGSASGDAAYELARKRRAEAIAAELTNVDRQGIRGDEAVAKSLIGHLLPEGAWDSYSSDAKAGIGGLLATDQNFMNNTKTSYLAPKQGSVYDAQAFKEQEAGLLSRAKRTPLENQEAAIQSAIQSKELQSLAAEIVGIMPGEVKATPEGMESIDFIDSTGPMGSGLPQNMDQITRAILMSGTKSGAGIGGALSAFRHQQEIQKIEIAKEQVEKEIVDTKALIQNSKLTEQQYKEGAAKLAKLQQMYETLTAEQNNIKAIANTNIADSNLAVTLAEEQNKISISNNKKAISDLNLKDAQAKSSFESKDIQHEKDINELERKKAELQVEISQFKVDEAESQADTAFSVFMEQSEDRATKGKIGEQKVKKVTYEAETADIKKDIAEIQKDYQEELKPLKLQYQEKQNQKLSEEITTEQTLRYFNANKLKASTRAILDKLAASLDISAQDLLKATSQAEKASTEAQSAKDLAPGLKKIQKSKIQQAESKAKLFAQELQQALKMDPVKFQKLMEQVDLIREQITGQTIKNRLSEVMLDQKQEIGDKELALKELEIEIAKKKSQGASLKNMETHENILIKQAPKNQKAVSTEPQAWESAEDQLATEIYDGALKAAYRLDSKNPNMIWQNRVPERVRILLKNNAIDEASRQYTDSGHPNFKNIRRAMSGAVGVLASGVIIAENDYAKVGIPNRFFTNVKSFVKAGESQAAKGYLMEVGYTGVEADAIIERAEKSTSSQ